MHIKPSKLVLFAKMTYHQQTGSQKRTSTMAVAVSKTD
jgi:hypothetical protein